MSSREHAIYNEPEVRGPKAPPKPRAVKTPLKKVEIRQDYAEDLPEADESEAPMSVGEAVHVARRMIRTQEKARGIAKDFVATKKKEEDARKAEQKAKLEQAKQEEAARKEAALASIAKSIEALGEPAKQRELDDKGRTAKQIEDTKRILGQDVAARIWDQVMPMFWKRDTNHPDQDKTNQDLSVDFATEYVHRVAEVVDEHKNNPAELQVAIKKLTKNFSNLGLDASFNPLQEKPTQTYDDTPTLEVSKVSKTEAKRIRKIAAQEEGPEIEATEISPAEIARELLKREEPLEKRLEKKYGMDPAVVYFELFGNDEDASKINKMQEDPLYLKWTAELKSSVNDLIREEEAKKEQQLREGVTRLAKGLEAETENQEDRLEAKFFAESDRMTRENEDQKRMALDDPEFAEAYTYFLSLENERQHLAKSKQSTREISRRIKPIEQKVSDLYNRLKSQEDQVLSKPEVTETARAFVANKKNDIDERAEYRRLGEHRNNLIKLNEDLTKQRMALLAESPINQNEVRRVSGLLNETVNKLRELEDPFGKVPIPSEQKPPVMDRIRGFFKSLFSGKKKELDEQPQQVNLSEDEFFKGDKVAPQILREEEPAAEATELEGKEAESVRREAGTKTLMDLAKSNKDFSRANIKLGNATYEALAYFQAQRGFDFKKTAYDADIVDADQAAEFIVALSHYVEARDKGINRVPASTEIRNIGKRVGIPDLLQYAQKFAAKKEESDAQKKKSKTSYPNTDRDR